MLTEQALNKRNVKGTLIKTFLPVLSGIFSVLFLLVLYNIAFHNGDAFNKPDNGFFKVFVPLTTLVALIVQFFLAIPIWKHFKSGKKIFGLTLTVFTGVICIISGLIFGLIFWERDLGITEFIAISLTGIVAFTSYWTVNLVTLSYIDKTRVQKIQKS